MPQKITNEQGVEVEVFTQEELDVQKSEALEQYKKDNPDKTDELAKLETEKKELEDKMKGLQDKDFNFANLKKALDDKDDKIKKLTESIDVKIEASKKEILEGVLLDHKNDTLSKLAGGDKDLMAKIELQYKRLTDTASTKEQITKKLNDAFVLATGNSSVGSEPFSSANSGRPQFDNNTGQKLTDEEKKLAKEMGAKGGMNVSEETLKKF